MSEKINPDDQDSNEPIKHSHYSNGVPTGREFEHLYGEVKEIHKCVKDYGKDIALIKQYIEDQKEAKKQTYVKAGILAGIISTVIGIISKAWSVWP